MNVMAFNGSPRKNRNTATLLAKALEGAASRGAETELVHLSDYDFKGCISCFSCRRNGGPGYGRCAIRDELTPLLEKVKNADALVFGAPNYIGSPSALMKAFLERLLYPYVVYTANMTSLTEKEIPTGFIYVMGSKEDWAKAMGYEQPAQFLNKAFELVFKAPSELLLVHDIHQFDDYSKYYAPRFDPVEKARRRDEIFPQDCQKAFEMGARLARFKT